MSDQTQAQFDAEVAEYAAMGIDPAAEIAAMLTPRRVTRSVPGWLAFNEESDRKASEEIARRQAASDLDVFTTAELEHQADLYYHGGMGLLDALPKATWSAGYRVAYAAAEEQLGLMRACHVELARRSAHA
jgi:hypothetical protein